MPKAIAIAIQQNPLAHMVHAVCDFMYGTEERTKVTYAFAVAMLILGTGLSFADTYNSTLTCGHDALAHRL